MTGTECNVTCRTLVVPALTLVQGEQYTATYRYFTLCDIMLPQYTQLTFWRCRHRCCAKAFGPTGPVVLTAYYDVINLVGSVETIPTGWEPDTGDYPINIQRVTGSVDLGASRSYLEAPTPAIMGEKGSTTPLTLGLSAYFRVSVDGPSLGVPCGADPGYVLIETSVEMGFR
ncbi:MAG: hypothetical protein BWY63_03150 [Chloroflexi bacterium ADurb.Bin360]|nr:MAG: hypothetical protein BWY63_03150 [Chloroflexi bacterium ADurb.Bin360]